MQRQESFEGGYAMGVQGRKPGSLRLAFLGCCLTTIAYGVGPNSVRQSAPQFTPEERTQLVSFWSTPGRYSVANPATEGTRGSWQVRLTPEGSQWLWNLNKGKKTASSLMGAANAVVPANSGGWEEWIAKRVMHDRWQALQTARAANGPSNAQLPPADKFTPELEPENPGPIPASLELAMGRTPVFAQAVQPKQFNVSIDDLQFQYEDNVRLSSPRYAYYRSPDGVMSAGVPLRKFDPDRFQRVLDLAGCDLSRSKVLKAVSQLEGGFDSINTYDTGYVSVGFIQFASLKEGAGSLGAMLGLYKSSDPTSFNNDFHRFGIDVQADGTLDVVDPATGNEFSGSDANARIIQDKRLIAVFQRAGQKSDSFCATQVKAAIAQYYPCDDKLSFTIPGGRLLTGKVGDVIRSEAGMAILFDRKVNTGNINALTKISCQVACSHHCEDLAELARYEKEILTGMKYRVDFTQDLTLSQPLGSR